MLVGQSLNTQWFSINSLRATYNHTLYMSQVDHHQPPNFSKEVEKIPCQTHSDQTQVPQYHSTWNMGIIEQNAHSNRHRQIWSLPLQSESRRQVPSVVVGVVSTSASLFSVVGCEISTKTTVGILVLGETLSTTDVISGHAIESNVPHGTRFGFGISGIDMDMESPSNLGGSLMLLVALKLYRRNVKSSWIGSADDDEIIVLKQTSIASTVFILLLFHSGDGSLACSHDSSSTLSSLHPRSRRQLWSCRFT